MENAIASDNAASADTAADAPEAAPEESTSAHETQGKTSVVNSAIEGVKSTASNVIEGTQSAASQAAQAVSGSTPRGSSGSSYNPQEPKTTVYVGNLFFDVTENDLIKEFARFGDINTCKVMRDARGLSKGYAPQ